MSRMDMARAERRDFADLLDELSADQWDRRHCAIAGVFATSWRM
jgi:hypothetical protein